MEKYPTFKEAYRNVRLRRYSDHYIGQEHVTPEAEEVYNNRFNPTDPRSCSLLRLVLKQQIRNLLKDPQLFRRWLVARPNCYWNGRDPEENPIARYLQKETGDRYPIVTCFERIEMYDGFYFYEQAPQWAADFDTAVTIEPRGYIDCPRAIELLDQVTEKKFQVEKVEVKV